jgi:aminoglycoside phosphotransferase (APT) family kinase protein
MLPDLRGFVRGIHRELLAHGKHNAHFQTAGGVKTYADLSVAYVLVNLGEGAAIVSAYEAETKSALDELMPALARAGVDTRRLAEAQRLLAVCSIDSAQAGQPYERTLRLAAAAERCVDLAREVPGDRATGLDLIERLMAAEDKFGIDWNAAVARTVASLNLAPESTGAGEVRAGTLQAYFESLYADRPDLRVEDLRLLPGAHSREVYFFDLADSTGRRDSLVLRRDREQNAVSSSVAQERPIMEALRQRGFPVPEVIAASDDRGALGRPFLAMRKIAGRELAQQPDMARYIPAAARMLAQLHQMPVEGLAFPLNLLSPPLDTAWARLLEDRFAIWRELKPSPSVIMERAYGWLQDHSASVSGRFTCVHGDFQPQNLLVDDDGMVGLLDFEVCHLGHPAEDLLAIRARIEPRVPWRDFFDVYLAEGGAAVSEAELEYCAVWVPFFYATIVATAYDTFVNHAGFDISTGAPAIVHLPQLLQFLSGALHAAD